MAEWIMKEETDMDGVDCYIRKGELVRCQDCKQYTWHTLGNYCAITGVVLKEDDFCSYGERKEE